MSGVDQRARPRHRGLEAGICVALSVFDGCGGAPLLVQAAGFRMIWIELQQLVEGFQRSDGRRRGGRRLQQIGDANRLLLRLTLARLLPPLGDDLDGNLVAQRAGFDVLAIGRQGAFCGGLCAGQVALRHQRACLLERGLDLPALFFGFLALLLLERVNLARDELVPRRERFESLNRLGVPPGGEVTASPFNGGASFRIVRPPRGRFFGDLAEHLVPRRAAARSASHPRRRVAG